MKKPFQKLLFLLITIVAFDILYVWRHFGSLDDNSDGPDAGLHHLQERRRQGNLFQQFAMLGKTAAADASKNNDGDRSGTGGSSEGVRSFAIHTWNTLRAMVRRAEEEDELHRELPFSASVAEGLNGVPPNTITVVVTKSSRDAPLGLGVARVRGARDVRVTAISDDSPFAGTHLRVGMCLVAVNGREYSSHAEGLALLEEAKAAGGEVEIVAAAASPATPGAASAGDRGRQEQTNGSGPVAKEKKPTGN